MNYYIRNLETQKLELHLNKEDYLALSEDLKKEIHSNFLFGRKKSAWVSRAKFPNLWQAETVAKKLGLADHGKAGETLSFEEQMNQKAARAEEQAERYELKSAKAVQRGNELQKPVHDMHGDIAFFTQPNVRSSSGRAFTNKRNKMFAAWDKGLEEFKKSEYYAEKAEIARRTAKETRPTDKAFIGRRIKEADKTIRAQTKNLESYYKQLEKIEHGQIIRNHSGDVITVETIYGWIENAEQIIENAISKSIYYHECLDAVGGLEFSRENIKIGYTVDVFTWGKCKVIGTGKVNFQYRIMEGGAAGMNGNAAYAEIRRIISNEALIDPHPFKVGEIYTVKVWNGQCYGDKEYRVTKVTEEKVTLKSGNERAITRRPRKFRSGNSSNSYAWALGIVDGVNGTIYKSNEGICCEQRAGKTGAAKRADTEGII